MIAAALLMGATVLAPNTGPVPTRHTAVQSAITFCEQVITQRLTSVPDGWDAFMKTADPSGRIKPLDQTPEIIRVIATQFSSGDQLNAILRQHSAEGDVWVGSTIKTPRCLIVAESAQAGIDPYADFVTRFGLNRTGWTVAPNASGSNSWRKSSGTLGAFDMAGFPVGSQSIGYFLVVTTGATPAANP